MTATREQLRDVYMFIVRNWAVNADDIPGDADVTKAALKKLTRTVGLVEGTHVNGERKLTYQSMFDIENDDNAEADAEAAFAAAFPVKAEKAPAAKSGATGPRYTDEQIKAGLDAQTKGVTNPETGEWRKATRKDVAAVAGVKSPNYFHSVLVKAREANGRGRAAAETRSTRANKKASAAKAPKGGHAGAKMPGDAAAKRVAEKSDRNRAENKAAKTKAAAKRGGKGPADLAARFNRTLKPAAEPHGFTGETRKWTAEVAVGGQPVPFDYPNSDTLRAVTSRATGAAVSAIRGEQGSDASVIIFKQLKGDAKPKRDRSVYVYRDDDGSIKAQNQGA